MAKRWIDARFGKKWKDHAKEHYTVGQLLDIAESNGRRRIIIEDGLKEVFEKLGDNNPIKSFINNKLKEFGEELIAPK